MVDDKPLKPYRRPKVYRSRQGARVTLVVLDPPDSAALLIKFDDFEGCHWNGRVVLHERKGSGDREQYLAHGAEEASAVLKWGTLEARPPGCDRDYYMHFDAKESEAVDPLQIIALYEQQRGDAPAAGEQAGA